MHRIVSHFRPSDPGPLRGRRSCSRISPIISCIALAPWSAASAQREAPGTKAATELLVAVLEHRALVIEGRTPIDACSLLSRMKTPADLPSAFPKSIQAQFDRRDGNACKLKPEPRPDTIIDGTPAWICRGHVRVDSLELGDSKAKVRLSVLTHGDARRIEDYSVVLVQDRWVVSDVRIWGLLYVMSIGCG
jgi:hypothetical protein